MKCRYCKQKKDSSEFVLKIVGMKTCRTCAEAAAAKGLHKKLFGGAFDKAFKDKREKVKQDLLKKGYTEEQIREGWSKMGLVKQQETEEKD